MKQADVPTDTLLAYTTSRDPFEYGGKATRAIVIDKAKHVERRESAWKSMGFSKADGPVPSYRTSGMLAVVEMSRWGSTDNPVTDDHVREAAARVREAIERDGVAMLNMTLGHSRLRVAVITGRALHMPWDEYQREVEKRDEARRASEQRTRDQRVDQEAALTRIRALGLDSQPEPPYGSAPPRVSWTQLEALINEARALGPVPEEN